MKKKIRWLLKDNDLKTFLKTKKISSKNLSIEVIDNKWNWLEISYETN